MPKKSSFLLKLKAVKMRVLLKFYIALFITFGRTAFVNQNCYSRSK